MRQIKAAAIQMKCDLEHKKNLQKAEQMIRKAAAEGANIILLPELFEREYFCQQRRYDFYSYARTVEESEAVAMGVRLAKELGVVLPISFYKNRRSSHADLLRPFSIPGIFHIQELLPV